MRTKSENIILLFLSLIFVVSAVFNICNGQIKYQDERDYVAIAQHLYFDHQFRDYDNRITAYRPPFYPLVLMPFAGMQCGTAVMRILNTLFFVLTAFLYGRIVFEDRDRLGQCVCVMLCAVYPIFYFTSSFLYPQMLGSMLFGLFSFIILKDEMKISRCIVGGIVYGVLVLAIPSFILSVPIIILFMLVSDSKERNVPLKTRCLYAIAIFSIAAGLTLMWTVRNYYVFRTFIPVSTNSGFNLFVGNNKNADYNSGTAIDWSEQYNYIKHNKLNELEQDAYFKQEAIRWITHNKFECFKLYIAKVLNYFNFRNEMFVKIPKTDLKAMVMFVAYYPLLLAALIRLFFFRKIPLSRIEKYLYLIYFGSAFTSAVFFTRLRFRVPFDFCLIAIVAIAVSRLREYNSNCHQSLR